jgi:hypothetical protein
MGIRANKELLQHSFSCSYTDECHYAKGNCLKTKMLGVFMYKICLLIAPLIWTSSSPSAQRALNEQDLRQMLQNKQLSEQVHIETLMQLAHVCQQNNNLKDAEIICEYLLFAPRNTQHIDNHMRTQVIQTLLEIAHTYHENSPDHARDIYQNLLQAPLIDQESRQMIEKQLAQLPPPVGRRVFMQAIYGGTLPDGTEYSNNTYTPYIGPRTNFGSRGGPLFAF